jgi:uncharacterized protein YbjT (DUF2867 family)
VFHLKKNKIMKYVLTGSIGNISKPVADKLMAAGHRVSIITTSNDKASAIEALGAVPLVGSVEDAAFLETAFTGADAVYLMIPPKWTVTDWLEYQKKVAHGYIAAIKTNAIKKVVVLSSMGAHMINGAGPVDGLAYLEQQLNQLPGVDALYLRPSYFYYNLFSMIPMIKQAGFMGSNQPASHPLVLTHTSDIATVAAAALLSLSFTDKTVRYIASDEKTWAEITTALGNAVGISNLPWIAFTDEQSLEGMLKAGLSNTIAQGYTAMGKALRTGEMEADYWKNRTGELGKVKLNDFAREFAALYHG